MKYLSLDLETTGVTEKSPENILQISAIVEDTSEVLPLEKLPHFTAFIKQDKISGEPYALAMNSWIMDIISGRTKNTTDHKVYNSEEVWNEFALFLEKHFPQDSFGKSKKIVVAGKNVAMFDLNFMPQFFLDRVSHRVIDPGMTFVDWTKDKLPSLGQIKESLGMGDEVAHDAYEDALDVIKVLRTQYGRS